MTDGILVCILLNPACYNSAGVDRCERVGACARERERGDLLNDVSC